MLRDPQQNKDGEYISWAQHSNWLEMDRRETQELKDKGREKEGRRRYHGVEAAQLHQL